MEIKQVSKKKIVYSLVLEIEDQELEELLEALDEAGAVMRNSIGKYNPVNRPYRYLVCRLSTLKTALAEAKDSA